jgi:hypothetical protein
MRDFEFQHHDGDDDGDDAVAEGFQPVFAHAGLLSINFAEWGLPPGGCW